MNYDEAKKEAQSKANSDGYNRILFQCKDEWLFVEQTLEFTEDFDLSDFEVIYPKDVCIRCGEDESTKRLHFHEESGEGWDHTDGGYYCSSCWINVIGSI